MSNYAGKRADEQEWDSVSMHGVKDMTGAVSAGNRVMEELAMWYPQIYLVPGEEGKRLYPKVVLEGEPVPVKDLSHFKGSPSDDCHMVETPAGEVRVVTLGERDDFVTLLRIMAYRCEPTGIPCTQGASFLSGVISRGMIDRHKEEFFRKAEELGGQEPDLLEWMAEQKRFLSDKHNFTDSLLILSRGPYSAVPAKEFNFSEEEWLDDSYTIRLYHECTHFVCYRLHPGERDAVRDEAVADAVGIIAAFGHFDRKMAERFLGICDGRYTGGRLENYTKEPQRQILRISKMFDEIEKTAEENSDLAPLNLALCLDETI